MHGWSSFQSHHLTGCFVFCGHWRQYIRKSMFIQHFMRHYKTLPRFRSKCHIWAPQVVFVFYWHFFVFQFLVGLNIAQVNSWWRWPCFKWKHTLSLFVYLWLHLHLYWLCICHSKDIGIVQSWCPRAVLLAVGHDV